ncbi:hypothetical protein [Metallosphaera turreted icosahedral virus 3]|nr:hypothetical protein [Metallosphaera turreted icosahedral virus 3]
MFGQLHLVDVYACPPPSLLAQNSAGKLLNSVILPLVTFQHVSLLVNALLICGYRAVLSRRDPSSPVYTLRLSETTLTSNSSFS